MFVLISTFSKTFDEVWLIYEIPKFLIKEFKLWQIAQITIKDNIELWVILNEIDINSTNIDISKIKSIIGIKNSDIFVNSYRNELISWIASYYITPIHNSTNLFFPKNLKEKIINWKIPSLTKIIEDTKYTYNHNISLSNEQTKAHNDIINSKNNKILFYWLTWSWKTEIYIKLIQENIKNNKQSLFLIPEIILTNQLSTKIKKVFWDEVIIINSTITAANKTKYWLSINSWSAKVIIWTRSSLFYPYNDLWLIIIDEEHDNSYISDSAPRYNSIEVAEKITDINWNMLILASWTPSVNSMYNAVKWKYNLVNLLKKYK